MGIGALIPLGYFVAIAYVTMTVFILVVMGIVAKIFGFSIFDLLLVIKDEIVLAFSTASSEAVLPKMIEKKWENLDQAKELFLLSFQLAIRLIWMVRQFINQLRHSS